MRPYYERAGITIYHGDCRDVLPTLGVVALVLTDPPYGVGLGIKPRSVKMAKHGSSGYTAFEDGPEYVKTIVVPIIEQCRALATRVVLTPGLRCLFAYPDPDALWCIYYPNGAGIGRWKAFTCWQPVLCYGKSPSVRGCYPDTFVATEQADSNGHPCPKPVGLWQRLMARVSSRDDLILDPFMGSGTTLVAAKNLDRRAIGIEIEERYAEIAAKRLQQDILPLEFVS